MYSFNSFTQDDITFLELRGKFILTSSFPYIKIIGKAVEFCMHIYTSIVLFSSNPYTSTGYGTLHLKDLCIFQVTPISLCLRCLCFSQFYLIFRLVHQRLLKISFVFPYLLTMLKTASNPSVSNSYLRKYHLIK